MTVLLFAGETYYPRGGWADLVSEFPTVEDAIAHAEGMAAKSDVFYFHPPPGEQRPQNLDWWHVVEDGRWVAGASREVVDVPRGTERIWWERDVLPWWE